MGKGSYKVGSAVPRNCQWKSAIPVNFSQNSASKANYMKLVLSQAGALASSAKHRFICNTEDKCC